MESYCQEWMAWGTSNTDFFSFEMYATSYHESKYLAIEDSERGTNCILDAVLKTCNSAFIKVIRWVNCSQDWGLRSQLRFKIETIVRMLDLKWKQYIKSK